MADVPVTEKSAAPTRKLLAGSGAGAATVVLVWIAEEVGVNIPPEVASAITTLLAAGVAYFVPNENTPAGVPRQRRAG